MQGSDSPSFSELDEFEHDFRSLFNVELNVERLLNSVSAEAQFLCSTA
jgi:hypothetical protein